MVYTLYEIDLEGNETLAKCIEQNPRTVNTGTKVIFTHSGLENYSTHSYKVKVTDGINTVISEQCSGTTYCLGEKCEGGYYTYSNCELCNGTGYTTGSVKCYNCTER